MQAIDRRELIMMRRESANACLHYGLFHAATLTACSGIELLLKLLYDELIDSLSTHDPETATELDNYRKEMSGYGANEIDWGLGRWIQFYRDYGIISMLRNSFQYNYSEFKIGSLWRTRDVWNDCKHSFVQADPDTARLICNFLVDFLEENKYLPGQDCKPLRTMVEFSQHWQEVWETSINTFVVQNRDVPQTVVLLHLAKYLALVVALIADEIVPFHLKTHLMVAANYVVSSVDLMPEDDLDVRGLVDDAAVLVFTLSWLLEHRDLDQSHLVRHWRGENDIIGEINDLKRSFGRTTRCYLLNQD